MTTLKLKKLTITALMAALTCIATMIIQVPTPTNGYIHLGDGFVLLSGILLGPIYGGFAAGIGSMFADLLSGYAIFAPATLIIKALAATFGSIIYAYFSSSVFHNKYKTIPVIFGGFGCGLVVTLGYLLFESAILGNGWIASLVGVPANIIQNTFGIIVSTLIYPILRKISVLNEVHQM